MIVPLLQTLIDAVGAARRSAIAATGHERSPRQPGSSLKRTAGDDATSKSRGSAGMNGNGAGFAQESLFAQESPAPASQRSVLTARMTARMAATALAFFAVAATGSAEAQQVGRVSGLPVPRFVSLKSDRVNLREGPSKDHRTTWVFERAGLPVEITAEFDTWRKVRDSEGTEGWVLHSLLSGRRTALVAPWKKDQVFMLYSRPATNAAPTAKLQPGVIANVKSCDGTWCRIYGDGFDGYLQQTDLWGVYPNEKID